MQAKELTEHVTRKAVALIRKVHGAKIGAMEFTGGWNRERVDAILFTSGSSFLIETKISRSDFLADKKKPFRNDPSLGVGTYRYYACPEGLIKIDELPEKWGLIEIPEQKSRSAIMPVGFGGYHNTGKWTEPVFEMYGTEIPEHVRESAKSHTHPDHPKNTFRFPENAELERRHLFALCSRYKSQKFMDNIL